MSKHKITFDVIVTKKHFAINQAKNAKEALAWWGGYPGTTDKLEELSMSILFKHKGTAFHVKKAILQGLKIQNELPKILKRYDPKRPNVTIRRIQKLIGVKK